MHRKNGLFILILVTAWLTSCYVSFAEPYEETTAAWNVSFIAPVMANPPTPTATPTPLPSPTPTLIQLTATVWQDPPQVPVLMYHRFNPQAGAFSSNFSVNLSDFDRHLSALYEAGFSLISLNDWVQGTIHLPEGKRPLIITIDDLFYADQLSLDKPGHPAFYSGVGRLWQFSQDHPDFNFHAALFYNFGDKSYANGYANGAFSVQDGWRQARAEAIAWGVENGAIPMNHFYDHPFLNKLSPAEIQWELEENEKALREALALVQKEHLAKGLPNILALPYVVWPATPTGEQVLFDYVSPEGAPVAAIVEGDFAYAAKLFPSPFSPDFDQWHVPRINATWDAIDVILGMRDEIPTAARCDLGLFSSNPSTQIEQILNAILDLTADNVCPIGIYIVGELAFQVDANGIIQLSP